MSPLVLEIICRASSQAQRLWATIDAPKHGKRESADASDGDWTWPFGILRGGRGGGRWWVKGTPNFGRKEALNLLRRWDWGGFGEVQIHSEEVLGGLGKERSSLSTSFNPPK